jgi:PAS domain S-box-containing protein
MLESQVIVSTNEVESKNPQALILIVDDAIVIRRGLRAALEREGYMVQEATNGVQALDLYKQYQPDLILLDAILPDISGFEVCSRLQELPGGAQTPIVIVTSMDQPEAVTQAFDAGAADYIAKPIQNHWTVLSKRIRKLIAVRQAEKALEAERNMLRALIDNVPDYIFIKDTEGRFLLSNRSHALAGQVTTPEELIGKTAFEAFPPEMAAQFHADDQLILQSGEPLINVERHTVDADGNERIVLTTKVPLRDDDGNVIGLVGISRDVTERTQA